MYKVSHVLSHRQRKTHSMTSPPTTKHRKKAVFLGPTRATRDIVLRRAWRRVRVAKQVPPPTDTLLRPLPSGDPRGDCGRRTRRKYQKRLSIDRPSYYSALDILCLADQTRQVCHSRMFVFAFIRAVSSYLLSSNITYGQRGHRWRIDEVAFPKVPALGWPDEDECRMATVALTTG